MINVIASIQTKDSTSDMLTGKSQMLKVHGGFTAKASLTVEDQYVHKPKGDSKWI